jgi:hypothetical protein
VLSAGRLAALCLGHLGGELHQVDLAEAHILRAQAINSDMSHVMYYHSSSEEFLETFPGQIDLLYLDTGDVSPIEPTARLHEREAEIIIRRNLVPPGGLILIDDVLHPTPLELAHDPEYPELHGQPVSALGKAKYSIPLFLANGFHILHDQFQVLLQRSPLEEAPGGALGGAAAANGGSAHGGSAHGHLPMQGAQLRIHSPRQGARVFRPGAAGIAWLHLSVLLPPPLPSNLVRERERVSRACTMSVCLQVSVFICILTCIARLH